MTGMRCTLVDDCDDVATMVISGGSVVLLMCEQHGRRLVDASDRRGHLSIRSLRRAPADPRSRPA